MLFKLAFVDSVPVLMGYSTMGFAAGMLLAVQGEIAWAPFWGMVTSAAFESGPLQYLLVDWVKTTLAIGSVLLVTLCVNFRYSLYGLSLIERFQCASRWQKAYLIGTITDETYAIQTSSRLKGKRYVTYCLLLTMLNHFYWIAGVTLGATVGVLAKDLFSPDRMQSVTKGIDFSMTALFLVILTDQVRERPGRIPAAIGFAAAFLSCLAFGRANMLIPSVLAILTAFVLLRRWLDD